MTSHVRTDFTPAPGQWLHTDANAFGAAINANIDDIASIATIDPDIVAIAALTPANNDILQRKAGAWTNSTVVQYKVDLAVNNVDNTSDATKWAATKTLTNTRITRRIGTTTSSATPTADADGNDQYNVTAQAANAVIGAPTGTPTDGQPLTYRIKSTGTFTLGFNAIFRAMGVTLPTGLVSGKTLYIMTAYNAADTKWDVLAVGQEA